MKKLISIIAILTISTSAMAACNTCQCKFNRAKKENAALKHHLQMAKDMGLFNASERPWETDPCSVGDCECNLRNLKRENRELRRRKSEIGVYYYSK